MREVKDEKKGNIQQSGRREVISKSKRKRKRKRKEGRLVLAAAKVTRGGSEV